MRSYRRGKWSTAAVGERRHRTPSPQKRRGRPTEKPKRASDWRVVELVERSAPSTVRVHAAGLEPSDPAQPAALAVRVFAIPVDLSLSFGFEPGLQLAVDVERGAA